IPDIKENWNIHFSDTGVKTGIAKRLWLVKDLIKSHQFHVTYGDGVSTINVQKVVEFHNEMNKKHNVLGTISAIRPFSKYGIIDSEESGLINAFREKPQMEEYVNIGFIVLEKEVFKYFEGVRKEDMLETSIFPKLAKAKKLAIFKTDEFFMGMDSYKDYVVLNSIWKKEKKWKVWEN
ncbi:glucose-1-phosphate cytidylyltransferase, partial [Candidatus Woesearchaeota archaeon]|nr:glucose-1-phosphate cytidylyltransferase [Candidatus Woesearchaeota archaeon]